MALKLIADYVSDSDTDEATDKESSGLPIKAIVLKNNIINACMHGPKPSNTGKPAGGETLRQMLMNNVPNAGSGQAQQPAPPPTIEQPVVVMPSGAISALLGGPSGTAPPPGPAVGPQVVPPQSPMVQPIPPRGLSALLGFGSVPVRPQAPEVAPIPRTDQPQRIMRVPQFGLQELLGQVGVPAQAADPNDILREADREFARVQALEDNNIMFGQGIGYIVGRERSEQQFDPHYGFAARLGLGLPPSDVMGEERALDAGTVPRYIQDNIRLSNLARELENVPALLAQEFLLPSAQGYVQEPAPNLMPAAAAAGPAPVQQEQQPVQHREPGEARLSSSSDSSDFEIESVRDAQSEGGDEDEEAGARRVAPRAQGELDLADLPPIEDLQISVPPSQVVLMGKVVSIIEQVVIVESLPEKPAIDLDSVLFLDKGARTLGSVHDVFGNVNNPNYVVRFNSPQHIVERDIRINMEVYYAPQTQFSKYVFLSELMKYKGTDASWLGDVEPPQGVEVDFSDDEAERQFMRRKKNPNRANRRQATNADRSNAVGHNSNRNAADKPPEGFSRQDRVYPIEPARFQPPGPAPGPRPYWQMPRLRFEETPQFSRQHVMFGAPMYNPFRLPGPAQLNGPNFYDPRYMNNNNNNNEYLNYYRHGRGNI